MSIYTSCQTTCTLQHEVYMYMHTPFIIWHVIYMYNYMYLYTCIITYNTCIYMYIYVHVYNISLAHDHCSAVSFPASPFAYIHNNFIRCIYLACIYACAQNVYYHYCDHYFVIKSTRLFLCFRTRGSKVIGWNHTERLGAKVIILCITMHVCSIRSYLMRANQLPIQDWIFFPSELCIYIYTCTLSFVP